MAFLLYLLQKGIVMIGIMVDDIGIQIVTVSNVGAVDHRPITRFNPISVCPSRTIVLVYDRCIASIEIPD